MIFANPEELFDGVPGEQPTDPAISTLDPAHHAMPRLRLVGQSSSNRARGMAQPIPEFTQALVVPGGSYTAILRRWSPGDASRCRLCPKGGCVAEDDICLLLVRGAVFLEDCQVFSTVGLTRGDGTPPQRTPGYGEVAVIDLNRGDL